MRFNLDEFKGKVVVFFKNAKSIVLIVASMAIGAWGYKTVVEMQSVKSYQHITNTIDETSVAVNEREELIIFNRSTGDYVVYDKQVRLAIFNQQFEKIQTDFAAKDPEKK